MKKNNIDIKGISFTLQEWKLCGNINTVKYTKNTVIKSNNTKIFRSNKYYSLIY